MGEIMNYLKDKWNGLNKKGKTITVGVIVLAIIVVIQSV